MGQKQGSAGAEARFGKPRRENFLGVPGMEAGGVGGCLRGAEARFSLWSAGAEARFPMDTGISPDGKRENESKRKQSELTHAENAGNKYRN